MIQISNIGLSFGGRELFTNVSFRINQQDRIGLTGKNGAGKSSLMKIIYGIQAKDGGSISIPEGKTMGYLPQEITLNSDKSVIDETRTAFSEVQEAQKQIEEIEVKMGETTDYASDEYSNMIDQLSDLHHRLDVMGATTMDMNLEKVLIGLGFEQKDLTRNVKEFSGGWQMRIELAKLLLRKPDLLLLDEPTNHLDIESILWLEEFFNNYHGAIVMVSHDRMFLDNITNRTIELVLGRMYDYKANYTKYLILREERMESQFAALKNQQEEIDKTEKLINKFRAKNTKAAFAKSLQKKLDRMDKIEIDTSDTKAMQFSFDEAERSGKVVVQGNHLNKHYGELHVIRDLKFQIERGEKVAFVGRNGEGKTTLVKMINDAVEFDGDLSFGHNVSKGYYAQIQENTLDEKATVFETVDRVANGKWANPSKLRGLLGAFLFDADAIEKRVKVLSGGEKSRLALARLLLEPCNLLILDEPTNHLDISAKEVLKEALQEFNGTLIVVSHDREFLTGLTDKTFEFHNHKIKEHLGEIDVFLRKHEVETFRSFEAGGNKEQKTGQKEASNQKSDYEARKQKDKDLRKLNKQISQAEEQIQKLEKEVSEIEEKMKAYNFYDNKEEADLTIKEYEEKKKALEKQMSIWEDSSDQLEKLD